MISVIRLRSCGLVLALLAIGPAVRAQQTPQTPAPQGTAKISGQVTRSDNGKPITNAVAQLLPASVSAVGKRVKVDAQGRFELTEVAAGSYVLNISADGFVPGAGKPIKLADGEVLAKVDVVMAPTSAIDGRLLDEFGDPAPGIWMQVAQLALVVGRTRLRPMNQLALTDDRGQFHIAGLPSGDYYLLALSGPFGPPPGMSPLPSDDRAGFAPTYFPGTPIASEAKAVHLDEGKDAEVTFALSAEKLANVSGTVVDVAGRPVGPASVMMFQTQGGDVRAFIPAMTQAGADGSFRYRNVPSGTYVLQGVAQAGFGILLLTVDGAEQSNLQITIRPPTTAHGHISFDGDGPPPPTDQINVTVRPTAFVSSPAMGGGMPRSRMNDDFSFDLPRLQSVGVVMASAPPPWRLKSATLDGKDVADTSYDFRAGDVTGLEVTLTSRVGSLTGNVVDGDAPAPGCSVIVFPDDKTKWAYPARLVTPGRSDPNGAINVGGLLPGRYLVVAVPLLLVQEIDPVYLESLREAATSVTIDEGKAGTVALKLIKR